MKLYVLQEPADGGPVSPAPRSVLVVEPRTTACKIPSTADSATAGVCSVVVVCPKCKRRKERCKACKLYSLSFFCLALAAFIITDCIMDFVMSNKEQLNHFFHGTPVPIPLLKTWLPWKQRPDSLGGKVPRILLWPAEEDGEQPTGEQITINPKQRPCYLATHKGYLEAADAIVFNASRLKSYVLPTHRHPGQLWVFSTQNIALEHSLDGAQDVAGLFNWTMSLRGDADAVIPYRNWTDDGVEHPSSRERLLTAIKSKSRSVAWFVSDCEWATRNGGDKSNGAGRDSTEPFMKVVVRELKDVTIFTGCGRPLCASRKECLEMAAKDFYFVFVFQTSPCFQDPAELIYDSFDYDIVPVYFGKLTGLGGQFPPGSVYDTTRVGSANRNAENLLSLRADPESYMQYLLWKDTIMMTTPEDALCRLCDAVYNNLHRGSKVYDNVFTWWKRRTDCTGVPAVMDAEYFFGK